MELAWVYVPIGLGVVILLVAFFATRPQSRPKPKPLPGVVSGLVESIAVWVQIREMNKFQQILSQMNSDEMASLLLMVTSLRLIWRDRGVDLIDPFYALIINPDIIFTLHRLRSDAKRQGDGPLSAGIGIWILTLRAARSPELRGGGRRLWRELQRGYQHVDAMAIELPFLHRDAVFCCGEVPIGIEPEVR